MTLEAGARAGTPGTGWLVWSGLPPSAAQFRLQTVLLLVQPDRVRMFPWVHRQRATPMRLIGGTWRKRRRDGDGMEVEVETGME